MMPALSGAHKTNITAVETALTAAIASMTNPSDSYQAGTLAVLRKMRSELEQIRNERNQ